jgi:hypothetical protein
MDILNISVKHKTLGTGKVIEFDGTSYLTAQFASKTTKFQFPEVFERFLTAEDDNVQAHILAEIQSKKDAEESAKQSAAEVAAFSAKQAQEAAAAKKPSGGPQAKKYVPIARKEGQHLTYLVFQGNTFDDECKGQFIWAPKYTKGGGTCHHWDRLMDVREGDVILHCADGYIKAVSRAKGPYHEYPRPNMEGAEELWEKDGRMIDCDYTVIPKPIKTSVYKEDILQFCQVKYAPFDKDGNGNMGYLFDIAPGLASTFLKASAKSNKVVADLDYIQWLIS